MKDEQMPLWSERLRFERRNRGWSQKRVGEMIGTSKDQVSRWENGIPKPGPYFQERLCEIYKQTAQELGFLEQEPMMRGKDAQTVFVSQVKREELERLIQDAVSQEIRTALAEVQHIQDKKVIHAEEHPSLLPSQSLETDERAFADIHVVQSLKERVDATFIEQESGFSNSFVEDMFLAGVQALAFVKHHEHWSLEDMYGRLDQTLTKWNAMPSGQTPHLSRRDALLLLAGIPTTLLGLTSSTSVSPFLLEEKLPLYTTGITACWRLYYEGGQAHLEKTLPKYVSDLSSLIRTSSKYQKIIASLLSQAYQLMALLSQSHENYGEAINQCKQSAFFAQIADDPNLQAMALIRQQDTYLENKRFAQVAYHIKRSRTLCRCYYSFASGKNICSPLVCLWSSSATSTGNTLHAPC